MVLVAVAAMGMLACQNEPETVVSGNDNAQKTTIEVIADLENTRSAFGEKGADDAYASYWQGGEQVKAAVTTYNSNYSYGDVAYYEVDESNVTTVTATGSVAQFSLTFDYLSATSGTLLIASPAGSVDFDMTNYYYDGDKPGFVVTIPSEQTPLVASVDPAAHILTATYTGSFANAIKPEWEHAAAYAKMTLKNFNAEIDNVVVTIDSKSYILNPDNVEGNVFWFACEANEAPSTVKVAVNTPDEKAYTKTLDLTAGNSQGLPFVKGNVAEFSVNMDGITPDEGGAEPEFTAQYMASDIYWDSSNSCFVFVVDAYDIFWVRLNEADRPGNNSILSGDYVGINSGTVLQGQFSVTQKIVGGWKEGWTSTKTTSTMSVAYVNGEYQILVNYVGAWGGDGQVGYKGVPDGWNAPGAGGEEPEPDPDPVQLAAPTNLSATATADTATISWDAVANASSYDVTVGTTTKNVTTTTATFDGLTPETTYDVSVVAVGDGTNYTNSTAATTTVKTLASATPEPEPDGAIVFSSCTYLENVYGMLKHYKFVSADGQNVIHVFMNSNNSGTATAYIPVGDYTNSSMNNTATNSAYFNMDCNVGDVAISDTKINGEVFANGISTDAANTMKVTEAANGGNHVIEFVIKGTTFRFTGTIQ